MKDRSESIAKRSFLIENGGAKDIRDIIETAGKTYGNKIAFREMKGKAAVCYSFRELLDDVNALGTALCSMGYEDKHIAIIGENSYRWIVSWLASILTGVVIPIDKEHTSPTVSKLINKCHADAIFCSRSYLATAREASACCEKHPEVFCWSEVKDGDELSYNALIEKGEELIKKGDRYFIEKKQDIEKMSAILFTSGTTGANKGVMLSQKNICANINSIAKVMPIEDISFSVLPMNHAFEFNCHILPGIYFGAEICINSSLKRLMNNLNEFKPYMTVVVPLFVDEIYSVILTNAKRRGKYDTLMRAVKVSDFLRKFGIDLRRKFFSQILENFGKNLCLMVCGGAAINPVTAKGLESFGIDIIPGYGITECSPLVSIDLSGCEHKISVGNPVPGVEVVISDPDESGVGEILVRGDNVTIGYYEDEESNAVSFSEGWFCTGDYGMFDKNGQLCITGRKKNLIILENGKNVHPEDIESVIVETLPYIRDVVVHEKSIEKNGKNYRTIAASISLKPDCELAGLDEAERSRKVTEDIRLINKKIASYKRIAFVYVTLDEFEKTTTHKVVRDKAISEKEYAAV
ncbi:MAG: AMP-binding protein [Oscillospiraceae bacterium]|nr:AMP-binding protein [Oscillospiraceae bacterium]